MDWVNDGGEDAPLDPRDGRILAAWTVGLLLFAVVVAAVAQAIR